MCPTNFYMPIFENFWVFRIYVTKTQVLIACASLSCIMDSYLLRTLFNVIIFENNITYCTVTIRQTINEFPSYFANKILIN